MCTTQYLWPEGKACLIIQVNKIYFVFNKKLLLTVYGYDHTPDLYVLLPYTTLMYFSDFLNAF